MINTISKIKKLEITKPDLGKLDFSDETLESLKQFKNKEFDVYTSLEDMWADVRAI